jgi:hypothetical protein
MTTIAAIGQLPRHHQRVTQIPAAIRKDLADPWTEMTCAVVRVIELPRSA